jgi:transposase
MRAYSVDLRERVVAAIERGMSRGEAVTTFAVSLSSIKRWLAKERSGQALTPGRSPGRPRRLGSNELELLRIRLQAAPDATLDAHTAWWNEQYSEQAVARATLDRAITRLGWSRKKSLSAPANETTRHEPPSASCC